MRIFLKLFLCFCILGAVAILCVGLWGANSRCDKVEVGSPLYGMVVERYRGDYLALRNEGRSDIVFLSDLFIYMYEHPCENYNSAVRFIFDPKMDEGQKLLVILSMQLLPAASYFDFSEEALRAYKKGQLSVRALDSVFFPSVTYSSRHQWYFWYPRWRELNKRAASAVGDRHFASDVDRKLSGETWWDWMDERADRGFAPQRR
ncbi:hypothetical protein IB274_27270 [Pseudomonas sp. PDM18]|uniref:hypothetical protein n=1 Tax=Pseudomonas sp. PDM18 TaxID=2769253 RepID=UPI00177B2A10|nr:hypothetical protein [Pseudomonas sp. PDM18]MBD9680434.1 hypothetical protein [Pseudomonas sp. PDM18]